MKKLFAGIILVALLFSSLAGCARNIQLSPAVNREYDLSDFSRIEIGFTPDIVVLGNSIDIPVDLKVTQSATYSVNLLANQNIFDYISVTCSGDTLKIKINRTKIGTADATIKASIAMPELEGLVLSSGILRADVFSSAEKFQAEISGASKLNISLQTGKSEFNVSSSSDVNVNGSASQLRANVTGASTFKADVNCTEAAYIITSSADVMARGDVKDLAVEMSGASSLNLDMQAKKAQLKLVSSSDITGELVADSISVEASGASQIKLKGSAQQADLSAVSSSEIFLSDFVINSAGIAMSGASEAKLNVIDQLDVDLSGSSELSYTGDPSLKGIKVSGDSSIDHK